MGIGLSTRVPPEGSRSLEQVLRMPASVHNGYSAMRPYSSQGMYRVKLATPFDAAEVEFNTHHLPGRFSIGFSADAPRRFEHPAMNALVVDYSLENPADVHVYEDFITLRNLQMLEGGFKGNSSQLLGREFYRLQKVTDTVDKPREATMNEVYARAREAMGIWVRLNNVIVPVNNGDWVTSDSDGLVSWLNPRDDSRGEPMDVVTAYQVAGSLRGFRRAIPDVLSENIADICSWRNDNHPSKAYASKDNYRRKADWKREMRGAA